MNKFLIIIGAIFLIVLVVFGTGFAYMAKTGNALDGESKAYAEAALPAILTDWNLSAIEQRESPEFKAAASPAELEVLFQKFRGLGSLKHVDAIKGEALISTILPNGTTITAAYTASAQFDHGFADISLRLIKHGSEWQILGFRLYSRALQEAR